MLDKYHVLTSEQGIQSMFQTNFTKRDYNAPASFFKPLCHIKEATHEPPARHSYDACIGVSSGCSTCSQVLI